MTTEINFGTRLSALRGSKRLTQKEFSELMGVSRGYLASVETGRQEPSFAFVKSLIDTFDVSADELIKGAIVANNNQSFVQIPRYTVSATAGNNGSFVSEPMDITYYAFNFQWIKRRGLNPKELQIIEVKGDSMEPKLWDGDLILIDRAQNEPKDGKSFVVRVWDEFVVKHVQIIGHSAISLISANSTYPPRELKLPLDDRDFQIIGQVVASMHEW